MASHNSSSSDAAGTVTVLEGPPPPKKKPYTYEWARRPAWRQARMETTYRHCCAFYATPIRKQELQGAVTKAMKVVAREKLPGPDKKAICIRAVFECLEKTFKESFSRPEDLIDFIARVVDSTYEIAPSVFKRRGCFRSVLCCCC